MDPYEITEILDWDTGNPSVADIVGYPADVGGFANGSTSVHAYGESNGWIDIENTEHEWISEYANVQVQHCPGNATTSEMRQEYWGGSTWAEVNYKPACSDFADGGGTTHFEWKEYNGGFMEGNPHGSGNDGWGIVTNGLKNGLEATRVEYDKPIRVESGYRCPHGNAGLNPPGAAQSYHMQGRAADLFSSGTPWTETEFNLMRSAAATVGGTVELFNWNTYSDHHLHVAW